MSSQSRAELLRRIQERSRRLLEVVEDDKFEVRDGKLVRVRDGKQVRVRRNRLEASQSDDPGVIPGDKKSFLSQDRSEISTPASAVAQDYVLEDDKMKVVEAQAAVLTNYEVYTHLNELKAKHEASVPKRRGPGNLETVVKEVSSPSKHLTLKRTDSSQVLDHLGTLPSPLGSKPLPYNSSTIPTLIERLLPFDLTKSEVLMIMNHRPTTVASLNVIIEEFEPRFPDPETRQEIANICGEVLGQPDGEADRQAMTESAKDARERHAKDMEQGEEAEADVDEAS